MSYYNLNKKTRTQRFFEFLNETPLGYVCLLLRIVVAVVVIAVNLVEDTTSNQPKVETVAPPIEDTTSNQPKVETVAPPIEDTTSNQPKVKTVAPPIEKPKYITSIEVKDQIHAALGRALRIDQSCYDPGTDLWLVHASDVDEGYKSVWEEGWYYQDTDDIAVLKLGNNTYSITNPNDIFNIQINPDITGLECKLHSKK